MDNTATFDLSRVIELDQWHGSTLSQMIRQGQSQTFNEIWLGQDPLGDINGHDTDAIKMIFGGSIMKRENVAEDRVPSIGTMWFTCDANGYPELYKYRYDSSG
jgi:hypothetical protein